MIRDFTTIDYCDFLWINDIYNVQQTLSTPHQFAYISNCKESIPIKNITIFGTIVEIQDLHEKGHIYGVDDGTAVILCKNNPKGLHINEMLDVVESEYHATLETETLIYEEPIGSCSTLLDTSEADDSVFNDKTIQKEDKIFSEKNRQMALASLWGSLVNTFREASRPFKLGDTVLVNGRLYTYYNEKQIYVNSMRLMNREEELIKIRMKLRDREAPKLVLDTHTYSKRNEKFSNMTFDNVNPVELADIESDSNEIQVLKVIPKRKLVETTDILPPCSKRASIVPPVFGSIMTFDSFSPNDVIAVESSSDSDSVILGTDEETEVQVVCETQDVT